MSAERKQAAREASDKLMFKLDKSKCDSVAKKRIERKRSRYAFAEMARTKHLKNQGGHMTHPKPTTLDERAEAYAQKRWGDERQYKDARVRDKSAFRAGWHARDAEVADLVAAIEQSIALADDYGDSGLSRPIREALKRHRGEK